MSVAAVIGNVGRHLGGDGMRLSPSWPDVLRPCRAAYKETDRSCDGRRGLEFDGKTEFGEAFDEAARLRLGPPTIEVNGSEIFIERAVFEHVIGGREDGGGNSADRFLRPASTA